MKKLTKEDIQKNHVENLKQYYVLDYLKKNLNIYEFELFIVSNNNIKIVDRNDDVLYFAYDENLKEVIYDDELISQKKDIELTL